MSSKIKIAILCDLTQTSGLGHISRMKNLSETFKNEGVDCFFLFEKKNTQLINSFIHKSRIIFFSNKRKNKSISTILKKYNFSILIIDSYKSKNSITKDLIKKNIFIVTIDDHLRNYFSNLVITYGDIKNKVLNKKSKQLWLSGNKYFFIQNHQVKRKRKKKNLIIKKILLHAGGSSSYESIKNFTLVTIESIKKYNLDASVLCTTTKSIKYIKNLLITYGIAQKIRIIPFVKNLSKKLHNYDLIVGPMGTTTLESIMSRTLPFSVPIKNDGRDSPNLWGSLGHLLHLKTSEKNNTQIIEKMWSLIMNNYQNLTKNLIKNSKMLDGKGSLRAAKKILFYYKLYKNDKSKIYINKNKSSKTDELKSYNCKFSDLRNFFDKQNQRFTKSFPYTQIIKTWPEHLDWCLKNNIKKYKLIKFGKVIGYHWIEIKTINSINFINSGWFFTKKENENINLSLQILYIQLKILKKLKKKFIWIILLNIKNKLAIKYCNKFGFRLAFNNNKAKFIEKYKKNYNFLAMSLKI